MDLGLSDVLISVFLALVFGLVWGRFFSGFAEHRHLCASTCRLCGVPLGLVGLILLAFIPVAADPLWRDFSFSLVWAILPAGLICQWRVYPQIRFFDPPPEMDSPSPQAGGESHNRSL